MTTNSCKTKLVFFFYVLWTKRVPCKISQGVSMKFLGCFLCRYLFVQVQRVFMLLYSWETVIKYNEDMVNTRVQILSRRASLEKKLTEQGLSADRWAKRACECVWACVCVSHLFFRPQGSSKQLDTLAVFLILTLHPKIQTTSSNHLTF